ncbi:MAG: DsbA family protein [Rhodobacterales bacterium]
MKGTNMFRNLLTPLILLALVVSGSFLWVNSRGTVPTNMASVDKLVSIVDTAADTADASAVKEMVIGAEDAKVTVIEYASFTCPHCANFHKNTYGKIKANYIDTGKIKFIMRDVYFDRFGLWAALIARCDGGVKFFGMSSLIYEKQREWLDGSDPAVTVDNLRKLGRLAGMEDDTMNACLNDNEMAQNLVAAFQENATKDEITSTPSFVINGKKYSNTDYDDFAKTLDDLLSQ